MMWDMELVMALEEYALPELEEILSVHSLSQAFRLGLSCKAVSRKGVFLVHGLLPIFCTVKTLYSGHLVKQPPLYYSHLLRSLVI